MGHKAHTGNHGIDTSVLSAYAKSLCMFLLPPLVANDLMTYADLCKLWASLGKKVDGIAKHISARTYLNLTAGGPKGAPMLIYNLGRGLRNRINQEILKPRRVSTSSFTTKS